jgi:hypothetical protein
MARVRVVLNSDGVREVLRSPGVLAELTARAKRIAAAAGPGMEVDTEVGQNRARASVRTATLDAIKAEAEDRALTRALDAGR